jgi:hypothetical protein
VLRPAPPRLEQEAADRDLAELYHVDLAVRKRAPLLRLLETFALEERHLGIIRNLAILCNDLLCDTYARRIRCFEYSDGRASMRRTAPNQALQSTAQTASLF